MKLSDFSYELPDELIAQHPAQQRTASRMLCMDKTGALNNQHIHDFAQHINAGDLLVLNNTKVIPARLFGQKETGGKIEILIERIIDSITFIAQIRSSKSPKAGQLLTIEGDDHARLKVIGRQGLFFELQAEIDTDLFNWLDKVGHMPLPPYIERGDNQQDQTRYQTVFAAKEGAVAAPTAGLHFDENLLSTLKAKGVQIEFVTLHVGAGTYQPVRCDNILEHKMHKEYIEVSQPVCDTIIKTKQAGKQVYAVGTTVVRSLETAATNSSEQLIQPFSGDTDIFIYPGFKFAVVDKLLTNFHLPESTLLMLVSAFSGKEPIMNAYQYAIEEKYRFFSYGDAMLLTNNS